MKKLIFLFVLLVTVFFASSGRANSYTLTTFTDPAYTGINNANGVITSGPGTGSVSLRSAIQGAENTAGTHTIALSAGSYNVTNGEITLGDAVNENITFNGVAVSPPTSIINMAGTVAAGLGGTRDRIFFINTTATTAGVQTTFNNVKFTNGNLSSDPYGGGAIRAGGPNNILALNNCVFENNTLDPANGGGTTGGAINISGGGAVNINSCVFNNNTNTDSDGGAVYYFYANNAGLTGSLSVSNCVFSNNVVTATGPGSGGAIGIACQGSLGGRTFSAFIQRNNFINNKAPGASGGAMIVNNGDATYKININYNRFAGNTASDVTTTALGMNSASGSVNAATNWWSSNTGPVAGGAQRAAIVGSGGAGTLATNVWLQLRHSASPNSILTNGVTTVTADILGLNSGGAATAANLNGLPAFSTPAVTIFSSPVLGALSAAGTQFVNGQATATFTAGAIGGIGGANAAVDSQSAITAAITVNQPPVITNANSTTFTTGVAGTFKTGATGFPVPVLSTNNSDVFPSGVTFNPATGNLSGTPAGGTGGIYTVHFTATNSVGTNTQTFTLTVNQPPAVTSGNNTTFLVGSNGNFTVTASGFPAPAVAQTGALPGGVTFNTGTKILGGIPTAGTGGVYPITFTTTNVAGTNIQNFTLTVNQAPGVACPADIITNGAAGACQLPAISFAAAATGFPSPAISYKLGAATITSPYVFPLGTNLVTSLATNIAGTNTCNFKVIVVPGPAPQLNIVRSGTNVVVSWTNLFPCYTLQFAPVLSSNSWSSYPGPFATNNGKIFVTNTTAITNRFYRLSF